MIFWLLSALQSGNQLVMITVVIGAPVALILGLSLHEFAHALVAYRLGDMSPVRDGRLTINPLAHFDPFGTILILIAGFGYGRPVMVNPYAFRMDRRTGMALVALAGPVTNVLIALAFGLALRFLSLDGGYIDFRNPTPIDFVKSIFSLIVTFNLSLAVFNMIPFPPLDGSKVLLALLPGDMAYSVERFYIQTQQYGMIVLFLILYFGQRFIGPIISGPADALYNLIVGFPAIF